MPIAVDKMHFKGHVDKWCQENCNPYNMKELENVSFFIILQSQSTLVITLQRHIIYIHLQVDTEVCEQVFSWLSRYSRITHHMNRHHFMFYILYICDLHNRMRIREL